MLVVKLRIDGQVFYSSAHVTFDVVQQLKSEDIKTDFWKQIRMYVSM